jgi:phosphate-selective porin
MLDEFRVGLAFTRSDVPEGLNSLQGRSVFGYQFFPRIYVKGRRLRLGAEAVWEPGPASIKWELIRVADAREEQSIRNADLSDLISQGWYLSGTWLLTGEKKAGSVNPTKELFRGGPGAVEVGARFERLGFGSKKHPGTPFRNPRAEHILENRDEVWTFGLTWYPNRWVKIQGNAIHDEFEDLQRTPNLDTRRYWAGVFRIQMVM